MARRARGRGLGSLLLVGGCDVYGHSGGRKLESSTSQDPYDRLERTLLLLELRRHTPGRRLTATVTPQLLLTNNFSRSWLLDAQNAHTRVLIVRLRR
jgi:hypothetical protein